MSLVLAAGAGFLIAVIWMDLMFDVLALGGRPGKAGESLPEESLAAIAGYYRRVTTTARPMNLLVGAVMAVLVVTLVLEWQGGEASRGITAACLGLCGVPIVLALGRVFPNAVRLGARLDPPDVQSRLARAICLDHLLCLAAMVAFLAVRLTFAA